jgi:hypothetical protein
MALLINRRRVTRLYSTGHDHGHNPFFANPAVFQVNCGNVGKLARLRIIGGRRMVFG